MTWKNGEKDWRPSLLDDFGTTLMSKLEVGKNYRFRGGASAKFRSPEFGEYVFEAARTEKSFDAIWCAYCTDYEKRTGYSPSIELKGPALCRGDVALVVNEFAINNETSMYKVFANEYFHYVWLDHKLNTFHEVSEEGMLPPVSVGRKVTLLEGCWVYGSSDGPNYLERIEAEFHGEVVPLEAVTYDTILGVSTHEYDPDLVINVEASNGERYFVPFGKENQKYLVVAADPS